MYAFPTPKKETALHRNTVS